MPPPCDLLTLKAEFESRVTWTTSVPILVFLGFCSRLRPDVRDRQTSDAHHRLMPAPRGRRHEKEPTTSSPFRHCCYLWHWSR